jgi:2-keto-3-deoxy-L-rhamnonate aldolase RhmA
MRNQRCSIILSGASDVVCDKVRLSVWKEVKSACVRTDILCCAHTRHRVLPNETREAGAHRTLPIRALLVTRCFTHEHGSELRVSRLAQELKEHSAPLLGIAAYFYDPIFVEIAAKLGFRVLWIEMEHAFITFGQAADLCRIASGAGMLTMIRIPDNRRENVLKAAECGPDIIDLPMADSPEMVHEFIKHARFRPDGARGYFSVPRALDYGIADSLPEAQKKVNANLCLMIQIETQEAVQRVDELCAIPGIDIFIGPADLSSSLGVPGQTAHPKVVEAIRQCMRSARKHGKLVAVGSPLSDVQFWADQGVDVLFCGNDIACLRIGAQTILKQANAAIQNRKASTPAQ